MLRNLAFLLLRLTLIPFLLREVIQRRKVTIVLYHDPRPEVADQHLHILKSRYNIIPLRRYVEAQISGTVDQLPAKSLIITLDDGYESNYELLPVLEKHRIPVTIFLCSGVVGTNRHFWFEHDKGNHDHRLLTGIPDEQRLAVLREFGFEDTKEFSDRHALSRDEIAEMKGVVDFQSHTRFHPILPNCSAEKAFTEISQSKEELERDCDLEVYALAYPNGNYSEREIAMTREAGYQCGVTIDVGFNDQHTDLFRLKRLGLKDEAGVNELLVKTSGMWGYLRKTWQGQSYG